MTKMKMRVLMAIAGMVKVIASEEFCSREFCLPEDYNKIELPPPTNGQQAVEVATEFDIVQYTAVDDSNFEINFVMYMGLLWEEPRILYTGNISLVPKSVSLGLDVLNHIWLPDLYIYNLKDSTKSNVVKDFAGEEEYLN